MMPELSDATGINLVPESVTAEEVAEAALGWIWMSGCYFPPGHLDGTGEQFRDVCRRLGGRFLAEVEAYEANHLLNLEHYAQQAAEREAAERRRAASRKGTKVVA
jgi:hypothetical protein